MVELMIVVVVLGIIASLALPRFTNASDRAKEKEADGILRQIYVHQTAYHTEHGEYASTHAELQSTGWGQPSAMNYYSLPADVSLPLCMEPSGDGDHHARGIDDSGNIDDC